MSDNTWTPVQAYDHGNRSPDWSRALRDYAVDLEAEVARLTRVNKNITKQRMRFLARADAAEAENAALRERLNELADEPRLRALLSGEEKP